MTKNAYVPNIAATQRAAGFSPRGRSLASNLALLAAWACTVVLAAAPGLAAEPKPRHLTPVSLRQVTLDDEFWTPLRRTWNNVTIADCFTKLEKDGAMRNIEKIRDGVKDKHEGPPWLDGLLYETIRGASDFLVTWPNPDLEKRIDSYVERIAAAQARDPDGYLNTYTQLDEPNHRWGLNGGNDNWQHDMYNAGSLVEAGIHYYQATGKTGLLGVAARLANHMGDVMGPPPKRNMVPGHSLAEEAVLKLYLLFRDRPELKKEMPVAVDEARYLKLVEFWIENRGNHDGRKSFEAYGQDHKPVLQQDTIEGHAVRATLLCTGLTAAAMINGREDYYHAAARLWDNMAGRRMYITGGMGAVGSYEGFAADYVLPNDGYLETCAAIGAAFFSRYMNLAFADARYADELERGLYNGILCAVSLKGDRYFYVNPLDAGKAHDRWSWHGCPCCPPMFLKIMGALPGYLYATDAEGLYVTLFAGSKVQADIKGRPVTLRQTTRYPWDGVVKLTIESDDPGEFDLNLRIPAWCQGEAASEDLYTIPGRPATDGARVKVNGRSVESLPVVRGYARLHRAWKRGDTVELTLDMPVRRVLANPKVEANVGRVALMRGPIVYCVESADVGVRPRNLVLPERSPLTVEFRSDLLGGVTVIQAEAQSLHRDDPKTRPAKLVAIPYYANNNRGPREMTVWLAQDPARATPAPPPTIAGRASASSSHCNPSDTLEALNDQLDPKDSADETVPRFTWWDHRGTKEWVQYDFERPARVSGVEVYWWDETRVQRHCRVPKSWRLLYRKGEEWVEVRGASEYEIQANEFNKLTFEPVETTGLRIEAQLQPEWSAGLLEWRVLP